MINRLGTKTNFSVRLPKKTVVTKRLRVSYALTKGRLRFSETGFQLHCNIFWYNKTCENFFRLVVTAMSLDRFQSIVRISKDFESNFSNFFVTIFPTFKRFRTKLLTCSSSKD